MVATLSRRPLRYVRVRNHINEIANTHNHKQGRSPKERPLFLWWLACEPTAGTGGWFLYRKLHGVFISCFFPLFSCIGSDRRKEEINFVNACSCCASSFDGLVFLSGNRKGLGYSLFCCEVAHPNEGTDGLLLQLRDPDGHRDRNDEHFCSSFYF